MAHTPSLNYDDISVGDTFTFDGDTTQDPCTVTSKDDKGGTVTLESSRTGAVHPYAPEFLSKVATRRSVYQTLFTPLFWVYEDGDVSIEFSDTFNYVYADPAGDTFEWDGQHQIHTNAPADLGAAAAFDTADKLIFRLIKEAVGRDLTLGTAELRGSEAAAVFRALADHIDSVTKGADK